MIKELLNSQNVKVYANWMGWFQLNGGKHIAGICQSDDPRTVRAQIRMAKALGIDGFVVDWYGYNPDQSAPSNQATLELMVACEEEGFEFSIMLDSGIFKWQADMSAAGLVTRNSILQAAMAYAQNTFLASPAYSQINGVPVVWEFGLRENGINMAALTGAFPGLLWLFQNSIGLGAAGAALGSFAWVAGFPDAGLQYLGNYLSTHHSDLTPVVPCLFWQFDDHDPNAPANSVWGGPARLIGHHWGATFTGCVALVKAALAQSKNIPAVQLCTWNDYEERTCFEPFARGVSGISTF